MADIRKIESDKRRVLELINQEQLVKIACDLVDIPSPTGSEKACADYIIERYKAAGIKVLPQVFEDGRSNAIGIVKGKGSGPTLMLNGHMDTSFVGNFTGPEEHMPDLPGYRPKAVIEGDWIYGLGVYNMKASLAAFIHAAESIQRAGVQLEGDLVIACVAGEIEKSQVDKYHGPLYRGGGCGTWYAITHGAVADLAVVGEPSALTLGRAHGGYVWTKITLYGDPMHSVYNDPKRNTINNMLKVAQAIHEWGEEYQEAVRVVVPYPAGGITDTLGRLIAQGLNDSWGQPVLVDPRAGAAGNIGSDHVAKSQPDGYTLLVNSGPTMVISASLYPKLAYNPLKDLAPVTQAVVLPNILVVHPSVPVNSIKELIALAKARPGKLNFASAGTGTVGHMAGELFKLMAGVNMVHVPYKGAAPAVSDLLGGQVDLFFDTVISSLPHVKAGKLRLLAVSSMKGSPLLPGVPTISDSGLQGFDANPSFGVFAPAMTPRAIISKLNSDIARILTATAMKQRLEGQGAEVAVGSPEQLATYMREESAKWRKVIDTAGIRPE